MPLRLSRREREILDVLHRLGRASAADVRAALADPPSNSAVRTHLRILEDKGHVRHEQDGPRYVYLPVQETDAAGRRALRHLTQTFFRRGAREGRRRALGRGLGGDVRRRPRPLGRDDPARSRPGTMTALASLAVKGLVVLLAAALSTRLLRRATASTRHGVWAVAFAALVLLPVLEVAGPRWSVGVLPAPAAPAGVPAPPPSPVPPPPSVPLLPPLPPGPPTDAETARPGARATHAHLDSYEGVTHAYGGEMAAFEGEVNAFDAQMEALGHEMDAWASGPPASARPSASRVGSASRWGLGLWALGALAVGLGWLAAFAAARRVVAGARPETDAEWNVTAERARRLAGLDGTVRLLRSDALDVPVAWGWGAPAVVLPSAADAWDEDRREAVLLHEMAHLARRDAWTQAVAQVALAVHWLNPLAWWAYRRFLDAREQACDDAVIRGGARPSAYAAHLVGVARAVRRERLALAALAPMARTAPIEGRVVSILDPDRQRGPVRRRALLGAAALAVAVGVPLAALQPVAQAVTPSDTPAAPQTVAALDTTEVPVATSAPDSLDATWGEVDAAVERARSEADRAPMTARPAAPAAQAEAHGPDPWTDEVERSLDDADRDIDEARAEIREMIREATREGGPGADVQIRALRQAEQGLAQIDRQSLRDQVRSAFEMAGMAPVPPTPPVSPTPPVPPTPPTPSVARPVPPSTVDWSDVDQARRDALRESRSSRRSR